MSQITAVILGSGGAGPILTLTGNSGGAVPPTAGNINVVGSGIVSVAGNPGTSTLTISVTNPIPIANGGTNATSMATTDGVVYFDGTRLVTTSAGVAGQVLTSNGAGVAPTYQAGGGGGGITSITGDSGGAQAGPAITLTGGSSGGTFAGGANTLTMSFSELNLPTSTSSSTGVINLGGIPFFHNYGAAADKNVFVGYNSGNFTMTTGTAVANVGLGAQSLNGLTLGSNNLGIGFNAGFQLTTGSTNNLFSNFAGFSLTSGSSNSLIGFQSAISLVSGSFNVIIGVDQPSAGNAYTSSESSNILIMNSGVVGESNVMRLGTSGAGNKQVNKCFVAGVFGVTVGVSGVPVVVDNAGQFGTVVSSERYKENIEDMEDYSDEIMDLRCVKFNYKNHPEDQISVGLIAEEVEDTFPQLVVKDLEGRPETVKYLDLIPMLLNEIQKLKKEIEGLEERIEELE